MYYLFSTYSHSNRGKCWSCIRTILVLLWKYFETSDYKMCAESSAELFYCQTSTIPIRYLGIYLGGILSPVFLLIQSVVRGIVVRGIVQGFEWVEILGFTVSLLFVQSTIELERGKILPFSNCKWCMYICIFAILS